MFRLIFGIYFTHDFIIYLCRWRQPSNSTEETLVLPRLPALRLVWMSSPVPPRPPLHHNARGIRTRKAPSFSPYRWESGTILKDLSKAHQQPITVRTAFANYVKDSLLTLSKAKYKKARSAINRLLSDLKDEDSDGSSPHPSDPASQPLSTTSPAAPQFNFLLRLVQLNLRAISVTSPHVAERAS